MDKKFLKQLARWHEDDEFQKIVDAILALPEEERDYDLTGQLARALNNLEDYETAAEVLLTVEAEGQHDPLWHTVWGMHITIVIGSGRLKKGSNRYCGSPLTIRMPVCFWDGVTKS